MTIIANKRGAHSGRFARQPAGGFEVLSFWGLLILICGGLLVFRPLIPPGWLDSMVLADMLLNGWVGDNPDLTGQFLPLQAIEPGQLAYLILAGIDAAVGPVFAPVFAAVLSLVLFVLVLHALVTRPGRQSASNAWPLSIVALTAISGVVLHRYPPSVLFGLTFGLSALAVWRHRFEAPDVIGTILLSLALTLTIGMDFQIFLAAVAVLVLSVVGEGLLEAVRLGRRRAVIGLVVRLVLLLISLIPAVLMLAYFIRNRGPDWASVLSLIGQPRPIGVDTRLYAEALTAFPRSAEPILILGLVGLIGLILLAGLIFRPLRGGLERSDQLLVTGGLLMGSALILFPGTLVDPAGPLTGAKAFWLGLILLIAWAANSPMPRQVRLALIGISVLVTAGLIGNRVLTYEHLAGQADSARVISNLVKKGSFIVGLDFSGTGTAGRVSGLAILQQSGIGLTIPALSANAQMRLLASNPPLKSTAGRRLADILGPEPGASPEAIRLDDFRDKTGQVVGSVFVMGKPPPTPDGIGFLERLERAYEPVYKFASGSLRGLVLYQPRPPSNDIRP